MVKQGLIPAEYPNESNFFSKLRVCVKRVSKMVSYILYKESTVVEAAGGTYFGHGKVLQLFTDDVMSNNPKTLCLEMFHSLNQELTPTQETFVVEPTFVFSRTDLFEAPIIKILEKRFISYSRILRVETM